MELMEELMDAVVEGNVSEVRWLLADGADVNAQGTHDGGETPLLKAARSGRVEAATSRWCGRARSSTRRDNTTV